MSFLEGAIFGVFGSIVYQLAILYQYRSAKKKWPWEIKKSGITVRFFIFGVIVKIFMAFSLIGMMAYTSQITGAWAAFIIGMFAESAIIELSNSVKKEIVK